MLVIKPNRKISPMKMSQLLLKKIIKIKGIALLSQVKPIVFIRTVNLPAIVAPMIKPSMKQM